MVHNNQKELIKDLEILEKLTIHDTNLFLHVSRVADLARGGYYHMKQPNPIDQYLNESDGVYTP